MTEAQLAHANRLHEQIVELGKSFDLLLSCSGRGASNQLVLAVENSGQVQHLRFPGLDVLALIREAAVKRDNELREEFKRFMEGK